MSSRSERPLDSLLYPSSVAVVGASESETKFGGRVLSYLVRFGFKGQIYPINSRHREILGLTCYPDIESLPEAPDVVVVAVPNRYIYDVLVQCCNRRVKNAVILSSGFAETGQAGRTRQEEIKYLASQVGMRIVGPNCLGIISSPHRMPLSATSTLQRGILLEGSIGFVSQSGAMAGSFLNRAQDRHVGLRYMISTGNEADLEIAEFIDYMVDDPGTAVIAAFIEGVRNPERFLQVADKALAAGKPIVALKVGRSERGASAARSHTGALTGTDGIYQGLFQQKGIVRVDTFEALLETAMLFSRAKLPGGDRIAVISSSGGAAGLVADHAAELGLNLVELTAETAAKVAGILGLERVQNPVDFGSMQSEDIGVVPRILEAYQQAPNVDAILGVMTTMPWLMPTAEAFVHHARNSCKPIVVLSMAGSLADDAIRVMEAEQIPVFLSSLDCLKAMRGWLWRADFLRDANARSNSPVIASPPHLDTIRAALAQAPAITEPEAKSILAAYGIPITHEEVARTAVEAAQAAVRIGFPVAVKIVSPDIPHKTEARGILLNLMDEKAVARAFDEVIANAYAFCPKAEIQGVLVQEMVPRALETIVGVSTDEDFGPSVTFGLGGVFAELLRDVSVRLVPLDCWDAHMMIQEIKAYQVLGGVRGQARRDLFAVEDVLLKLSTLASDLHDCIDEIDLNPLMVLAQGEGVKVADALVVPKRQHHDHVRTL